MNFIEKLLERIDKEEITSLKNVVEYRKLNCKEAELSSVGESVSFSIVKDIIKDLLKDKDLNQDIADLNHYVKNAALNCYSADAELNNDTERIRINAESSVIMDAVKKYTDSLNNF